MRVKNFPLDEPEKNLQKVNSSDPYFSSYGGWMIQDAIFSQDVRFHVGCEISYRMRYFQISCETSIQDVRFYYRNCDVDIGLEILI